jgi:hypothetical protein
MCIDIALALLLDAVFLWAAMVRLLADARRRTPG